VPTDGRSLYPEIRQEPGFSSEKTRNLRTIYAVQHIFGGVAVRDAGKKATQTSPCHPTLPKMMRQGQRSDRRARGSSQGFSPKSACLGAFLILLLNLLVLSGPAYARVGSVLPIDATPAAGGGAAQSANSEVQPAVAPVTKAVAQTVEQTTTPVTGVASQETRTVTAPASGAVTHSASAVTTPAAAIPVPGAPAQTVRKTVASTLETAANTIHATTAPIVETAGKSVSKVAVPGIKTGAPVLDRTEQTVVKAAAPVLQTATHTIGGVATPVGAVTTSTAAGVLQGVDGTTAIVSKVASQGIGQVAAPVVSTVTQVVSPTATGAGQLAAPLTTPTTGKGLSNPPARAAQDLSNAPSSVMNATPPTTPPSPGVLLSGSMPAPRVLPPGISASAEELLIGGPLPAHPARIVSFAQIASVVESLATFPIPRNGDYGRRAGTPPSTSILRPPASSPLPGGSLSAMAPLAGAAFSIFLTLAGLLLMGGLAAMRLLRLASEPWRRAPFVLIPERPG
jgi:hypothetical protein